ncbi:MAG: hypothetical protein IPM79_38120 [Polyangiaceae bacterium]|jgi:tetratricopeptide (TPR) repeat protein|nr:hypothetical protein [Polyangiaceae bacterium]MBK8943265.1 hypothetical protein [Polyangiaceae bacterium]
MTVETQPGASPNQELIERLRAEIAAAPDRGVQALLLNEVGVLHEVTNEEPLAARDYLASYNADADFREPLEALVRILSRRRSFKNLAKLLDALAKSAPTPEERSRALREMAVLALEHDKNKEEAQSRLEEAVAENPDDMAAWLEIEMLAAEAGDTAGVMRAVEARLPLINDATYKALLYIQLAELAAKVGQTQRAYEHLDAAAALEGRSRFQTRIVLERVAQSAADLEAMARALEGQAELVIEVLDDPERGEEIGVPAYMRTPAVAADAWVRSAEIRRRLGDLDAASSLLAQAARRLPESAVVARARLAALEVQGDLESAAAIAQVELGRGATGSPAAALWLRVAEAAALGNDRVAALDALRHALAADPGAIPARAIEIDLLMDGQDPSALAGAIEGAASTFATGSAKARAFLLAAYVWACLARDAQAAQTALDRAVGLGAPHALALRLARTFAAITEDAAWTEATTEQLLATELEPAETAGLLFELGRLRLLRGEIKGAEEAFGKLAGVEGSGPLARSQWLGRMLSACAVGLAGDGGRSAEPMDALAATEEDPNLSRALSMVAALRAAQAGDLDGARARLSALHEAAPADEIASLFLAELLRDEPSAAARVLSRCAGAVDDSDLAAALRVEAALLSWTAQDRPRALAELDAVREAFPESSAAASALAAWARRGLDPASLEGRREVLVASAAADGRVPALERFGLEVAWLHAGGDPGEALAAVAAAEQAEQEPDEITTAAALARVLWPTAFDEREPALVALEHLEQQGGDAALLARAERLRIARDVDRDPVAATVCGQQWAEVEPTIAVALEWLSAAMAAEDRAAEAQAREVLARGLEGAASEAMLASAAAVRLFGDGAAQPLLEAEHAPGRLMNLELAPLGCDPRKRASALHGVGEALGAESNLDALTLAGYSELAAGNAEAALETFRAVADARPDSLAAWEGVRSAAEALDQPVDMALACAQLGALCKDDARGASFWERAGLLLLERTEAHDDAEIALDRAFTRDPRCSKAFDKLFRRVRERNELGRMLGLIDKRLEVADDDKEISKLFWERARVLQKKGDNDGALAALENVTMLEPDHVGALALSGTISIQKGDFAGAAPIMARLSRNKEAPRQERLVSGITASEFFENKLNQPDKALEVLVDLHKEGLSTLAVRERLARAAAKSSSWQTAIEMFETLMEERDTPAGRIDAARLSLAIWRDKLKNTAGAQRAAQRILEEAPDDVEAIETVMQTNFDETFRMRMLARGKQHLVESLQRDPFDADRVDLLARMAAVQGDPTLRQAAQGVLVALGKSDRSTEDSLAQLDQKVPHRPQRALDPQTLAEIADTSDAGPVPRLLLAAAETTAIALGPTLESLGVSRKNRVDKKGAPPIWQAVAEWMGALGFEVEFELYVGGRDPDGVQGVIVGEVPALVVGERVDASLAPVARAALAREVFTLRRYALPSLRTKDDAAIASVVIALCNELGAAIPKPPYPIYVQIAPIIKKELSRRVRKAATDLAHEVARSGQDPIEWVAAARRSCDRMGALAAGDVSIVLSDILERPRNDLSTSIRESERAMQLMRFVLSPGYLDLRRKIGMVGSR